MISALGYLLSKGRQAMLSLVVLLANLTVVFGQKASLEESLLFHVPFDGSVDATVALGDKAMYTAENLKREVVKAGQLRSNVRLNATGGRHGGCLEFLDRSDQVLMFKGENVGFKATDWSGTISLWMRLSPDADLKPGYCDPLQITDKAWNDAAFFIDFDKDLPRDFRLGVFSEYSRWNPQDIPWEKLPVAERPMIVVKESSFDRDRWTHVAWTFSGLNSRDGNLPSVCKLYIDGVLQGSLDRSVTMHWDLSKTALMLGIEYIGSIDDLAIFDRALRAEEVLGIAQGKPIKP